LDRIGEEDAARMREAMFPMGAITTGQPQCSLAWGFSCPNVESARVAFVCVAESSLSLRYECRIRTFEPWLKLASHIHLRIALDICADSSSGATGLRGPERRAEVEVARGKGIS